MYELDTKIESWMAKTPLIDNALFAVMSGIDSRFAYGDGGPVLHKYDIPMAS